jgi:hypothetical protein
MTHASAAALASGYERSRSGKATLTMERSSAAMKAPRAVSAKTAERRAGSGTAVLHVGSVLELTLPAAASSAQRRTRRATALSRVAACATP